jgi:hypothetical protein
VYLESAVPPLVPGIPFHVTRQPRDMWKARPRQHRWAGNMNASPGGRKRAIQRIESYYKLFRTRQKYGWKFGPLRQIEDFIWSWGRTDGSKIKTAICPENQLETRPQTRFLRPFL